MEEQSGNAQLLIVVLILVAIVLGVMLVGQSTNFWPQAANNQVPVTHLQTRASSSAPENIDSDMSNLDASDKDLNTIDNDLSQIDSDSNAF